MATKFAKNLRARADALGLSHAAIAERAGVTPRAFSHYVTGQREPGLDALVRLSNSVGSTPNELLGVDEVKGTGGDDKTRVLNRISSACGSLNARELMLVDAVVDAMVSEMAETRNKKKQPE